MIPALRFSSYTAPRFKSSNGLDGSAPPSVGLLPKISLEQPTPPNRGTPSKPPIITNLLKRRRVKSVANPIPLEDIVVSTPDELLRAAKSTYSKNLATIKEARAHIKFSPWFSLQGKLDSLKGADLRYIGFQTLNPKLWWGGKIRHHQQGPKINLNFADLEGTRLDGANLTGVSLRGANLKRASLSRARLTRVDCRQIKPEEGRAIRRTTCFDEANLTRARVDGADLGNASFIGAKLCRVHLTRASNLTDALFTDADLTDAKLCDETFYRDKPCIRDERGV